MAPRLPSCARCARCARCAQAPVAQNFGLQRCRRRVGGAAPAVEHSQVGRSLGGSSTPGVGCFRASKICCLHKAMVENLWSWHSFWRQAATISSNTITGSLKPSQSGHFSRGNNQFGGISYTWTYLHVPVCGLEFLTQIGGWSQLSRIRISITLN